MIRAPYTRSSKDKLSSRRRKTSILEHILDLDRRSGRAVCNYCQAEIRGRPGSDKQYMEHLRCHPAIVMELLKQKESQDLEDRDEVYQFITKDVQMDMDEDFVEQRNKPNQAANTNLPVLLGDLELERRNSRRRNGDGVEFDGFFDPFRVENRGATMPDFLLLRREEKEGGRGRRGLREWLWEEQREYRERVVEMVEERVREGPRAWAASEDSTGSEGEPSAGWRAGGPLLREYPWASKVRLLAAVARRLSNLGYRHRFDSYSRDEDSEEEVETLEDLFEFFTDWDPPPHRDLLRDFTQAYNRELNLISLNWPQSRNYSFRSRRSTSVSDSSEFSDESESPRRKARSRNLSRKSSRIKYIKPDINKNFLKQSPASKPSSSFDRRFSSYHYSG